MNNIELINRYQFLIGTVLPVEVPVVQSVEVPVEKSINSL